MTVCATIADPDLFSSAQNYHQFVAGIPVIRAEDGFVFGDKLDTAFEERVVISNSFA
jgi:hypothetical protein